MSDIIEKNLFGKEETGKPPHANLQELLATCDRLDANFPYADFHLETSKIRALGSELSRLACQANNLINAISQLLHNEIPAETIENSLNSAASLIDAERGFMLLYSQTLDTCDRIAACDLPSPVNSELEIAEHLATTAFEYNQPILNPDLTIDPKYSSLPGAASLAERSIIITPITVEMESEIKKLGVLYFDCMKSAKFFSNEDLKFLTSYASVIGLLIWNARITVNLRLAYQDTIHALVKALEARDPFTAGHSERVAEYSVRCAKYLNLGRDRIEILRSAALLHDIGKIGIRDDVLQKPGRLTLDEFNHIKKHPEISESILKGLNFLSKEMRILSQHHERYDGTGYPKSLKGDEISLEGAIIQIADSWDAMTSRRVYKREMNIEEGLEELKKNSRTQFDPVVIEAFINMIREEGLVIPDKPSLQQDAEIL